MEVIIVLQFEIADAASFFYLQNITQVLPAQSSVGIPSSTFGNTTGGPSGPDFICGASYTGGGLLVYEFADGTGMEISANTYGTDSNYGFDSSLWVLVFDPTNALYCCIGGTDDSSGSFDAEVRFVPVSGVTYYILIGGFGANEGAFDLTIEDATGLPAPSTSPSFPPFPTPAPTTSAAPSLVPSVSPTSQPTTAAPTTSAAPSSSPTRTAAPTTSAQPSFPPGVCSPGTGSIVSLLAF